MIRPRMKAALAAVGVMTLSATALNGVTISPASAAGTGAYSGSANSSVVGLSATAVGLNLAAVSIGRAETGIDTAATPKASAESRNIQATVAGLAVPVSGVKVVAPPSASDAKQVGAVGLPGLLNLGLITESVAANYVSDDQCVPAVNGVRTLTSARTEVASATIGSVPLVGALAEVGAGHTTSGTELVDTAAAGDSVRSTATTSLAEVKLAGGAAIIRLSDDVRLTAVSDGTTGSVSINNVLLEVVVNGAVVASVPVGSGLSVPATIPLVGSLTVNTFALTDSSLGAAAAGTLDAIADIDLSLLGGTATANVTLGGMDVSAAAPSGGVNCVPVTGGPGTGGPGTGGPGTGGPGTGGPGTGGPGTGGPGTGGPGTGPGDDPDHDGLTNQEEQQHGTNPNAADSDNDGLTDGAEVHGVRLNQLVNKAAGCIKRKAVPIGTVETNPLKRDTDGDRLTDGQEVNGITIKQKVHYLTGRLRGGKKIGLVRTNPLTKDTDADGLKDKLESKGYKIKQKIRIARSVRPWKIGKVRSSPVNADTDCDKLKDKAEKTGKKNKRFHKMKTSPVHADTDRGGRKDGWEVKHKKNPSVANLKPGAGRSRNM